MTELELEVWEALDDREWLRPMDLGARDSSHHSRTLNRMVKKGLVEKRSRKLGGLRGSFKYRRAQTRPEEY